MNRNGAASIVLIFAVLCLSIFAVVSFVPALREDALITREVGRVTAFYAADARAEYILAEILTAIYETHYTPGSVEGVQVYSDWDWETFAEWVWFAYPINDTLDLYVRVAINADMTYTILAWRVMHTGEWEVDERLNVWPGPDENGGLFGW